jgi:hypothetical protein
MRCSRLVHVKFTHVHVNIIAIVSLSEGNSGIFTEYSREVHVKHVKVINLLWCAFLGSGTITQLNFPIGYITPFKQRNSAELRVFKDVQSLTTVL